MGDDASARQSWGARTLTVAGVLGLVASAVVFPVRAPNRPWEMGIAALASLALVAIANIDRFSHLKAGDYELHLREAQRAVEQTQVNIEQVRALAATLATTMLDGIARIGVLGRYPDTDKLALKNQLMEELRALGVTDEGLRHVGRTFDGMMRLRHVVQVRKAIHEALDERGMDRDPVMLEFRRMLGARNMDPVTPEEVRRFVEELGVKTEDVESALQDYEYFVKHGRHRRPEVWEVPE